MSHMKAKHHAAIHARATSAIQELYHNATPDYPRDVPDDQESQDAFQSWFGDTAQNEIDYIRDGGAYAKSRDAYRRILEHSANAGRYQSEVAQRYYVRMKMREMDRERSRCNSLDSREAQTNAAWERINEYGALYTWGRGGRTLAPDDLIKTGGGSSFHVREDYADDLSIARTVELITIVESFNRHVGDWCKSIPEQWHDYLKDQIADREEAAVLSDN